MITLGIFSGLTFLVVIKMLMPPSPAKIHFVDSMVWTFAFRYAKAQRVKPFMPGDESLMDYLKDYKRSNRYGGRIQHRTNN